MSSDLPTARAHLEAALDELSGDDEFSNLARQAIGMMIDSILALEHRRTSATVVPFPLAKDRIEDRSFSCAPSALQSERPAIGAPYP
ncbi:MAG: hypothetical protein AB7P20_11485 [Rhizobiaceae bacterium]